MPPAEDQVGVCAAKAPEDSVERLVVTPVVAFDEAVTRCLGSLASRSGVEILPVQVKSVMPHDPLELGLEVGSRLRYRQVQDAAGLDEPVGVLLVDPALLPWTDGAPALRAGVALTRTLGLEVQA
jgi:hypothetical protein